MQSLNYVGEASLFLPRAMWIFMSFSGLHKNYQVTNQSAMDLWSSPVVALAGPDQMILQACNSWMFPTRALSHLPQITSVSCWRTSAVLPTDKSYIPSLVFMAAHNQTEFPIHPNPLAEMRSNSSQTSLLAPGESCRCSGCFPAGSNLARFSSLKHSPFASVYNQLLFPAGFTYPFIKQSIHCFFRHSEHCRQEFKTAP